MGAGGDATVNLDVPVIADYTAGNYLEADGIERVLLTGITDHIRRLGGRYWSEDAPCVMSQYTGGIHLGWGQLAIATLSFTLQYQAVGGSRTDLRKLQTTLPALRSCGSCILLGFAFAAVVEGQMTVLEELLLPAIEQIGGDAEFIAQVGDRRVLQELPLRHGDLLQGSKLTTCRVLGLAHATPP